MFLPSSSRGDFHEPFPDGPSSGEVSQLLLAAATANACEGAFEIMSVLQRFEAAESRGAGVWGAGKRFPLIPR